jgi:FHS family L-fucose permease-like MFS transporter
MSEAAALRALLALFFLWGFLTCLNDILVPHLRSLFALSYTRAVLIPVTFFTTCFVFAPISGIVIERLGYRRAMVAGLLTMGVGALAFLPAAQTNRFACFLIAIGMIGAGITVLQAAATPYVSFLGPPETAPSRFSLVLAFNSLGTMVAPLFGGWFILRTPADFLPLTGQNTLSLANRALSINMLRGPYLFLGCTLVLLAAALALSGLPQMRTAPAPPPSQVPVKSVFRHGPLVFGAITAFLYAGAEVGIGSFLVNYLSQPGILGVNRHDAALLATFYWGGAVVGRFFGWRLLQSWRAETTLAAVSTAAGLLVGISVTGHGIVAAVALLSVGLCNAMIVPIVVMLAISGLGPLTTRATSMMVAANIGAGLVPLGIGMLADRVGVHHALAPIVICYAAVLYYALRGSRGNLLPPHKKDGAAIADIASPLW